MFDTVEHLQIVAVLQGESRHTRPKPQIRKTHAFIIRTNGTGCFEIDGKVHTTHVGELFFLPQGTTYIFTPDETCSYMVINFLADLENPKPMLFSLDNFPEAAECIRQMPKMWNIGKPSDKHKCLSLFYALLSFLSCMEHVSYAEKKHLTLLTPAILYLEEHLFDCNLKTECLHRLCDISDTYFRKLFHIAYGMSPKSYVVRKRLAHAKAMMETTSSDSVSRISESVGYTDPLYFSRAFKKRYGVSPQHIFLNNV